MEKEKLMKMSSFDKDRKAELIFEKSYCKDKKWIVYTLSDIYYIYYSETLRRDVMDEFIEDQLKNNNKLIKLLKWIKENRKEFSPNTIDFIIFPNKNIYDFKLVEVKCNYNLLCFKQKQFFEKVYDNFKIKGYRFIPKKEDKHDFKEYLSYRRQKEKIKNIKTFYPIKAKKLFYFKKELDLYINKKIGKYKKTFPHFPKSSYDLKKPCFQYGFNKNKLKNYFKWKGYTIVNFNYFKYHFKSILNLGDCEINLEELIYQRRFQKNWAKLDDCKYYGLIHKYFKKYKSFFQHDFNYYVDFLVYKKDKFFLVRANKKKFDFNGNHKMFLKYIMSFKGKLNYKVYFFYDKKNKIHNSKANKTNRFLKNNTDRSLYFDIK